MTDEADRSVQYQTESLVHKLLASPEVAAAEKEIRERIFEPRIPNSVAREWLNQAVDETVIAALLAVAGRDPADPRLTWYECPPHVSYGRPISGGRYGFDNPDRAFRYFFIDPASQYQIRGRRHRGESESFYLLLESCEDKPPGWGYPLAFLYMESIDFGADGSFTITADGTPTDGRRNHLHLPANSAHVLIRETMLKWNVQMPSELSVSRVAGSASVSPSFDEMRAQAASTIIAQAENAFLWYDFALAKVPPNTVATPQIRPAPPGETPWGMTTAGRFSIAEDEAFVFTVDRESAQYLGVQIATPWMVSIDYGNHTSCLNHDEVWHNPDGTVTYIVAAADPGVSNWLDNAGITDGVMLLRWELLQQTPDVEKTVRDCRVVKLRDIAEALPFAMAAISPDQRQGQIELRRNGIRQRQVQLLAAGRSFD